MRRVASPGEHFAVEYTPETLPWVWVLEEVTGFHLEDDANYRAKVREYYWKTEIEEPSPFPWSEYSDDSGVWTKDDIIYREQQRQHYLKAGREEFAKSHNDPDGKGYVREIAIPHLLDWWDKIGVKKFGSNAKGKNDG